MKAIYSALCLLAISMGYLSPMVGASEAKRLIEYQLPTCVGVIDHVVESYANEDGNTVVLTKVSSEVQLASYEKS